MKTALRKPLLLLTAIMLPGSFLQADNVWDGGGASGSWSDFGNWGSNTTPVSPTALTFGGVAQLANTNDLFSAGTQFNGITFSAGAGAFVIGGNAITLGNNIVNSSTSQQTINLDMALAAVRNVTMTTGGGDVVLGGDISGVGGGITTAGTGTLTLLGNNTYTGDTTVAANTKLVLGNENVLGSGTLRLTGGSLEAASNLSGANKIANNVLATIGATVTGTNSIEIGGSYSLNNSGNRSLTNNISTGTLTLNNVFLNLDATAGRVLTLDGTGTTVVKGVIANGAASNLLGINGTATVILENANTYSGGTNLSSATATLILGNKAALGTGQLNIISNGTIQASTDLVGANKIANNIISTAGVGPTFSGSHSLEIGGKYSTNVTGNRSLTNNIASGKVLILNDIDINLDAGAARTLTIAGSGNTNITGVIANGSVQANRLTITNTGITTLSGSNSYTGITTLSAGMTVFANTSAKASATATAAAGASVGLGVGGTGFYSSANVDSLFANTLSGFSMNAASGVGIDTTAGDFTYATNQAAARSLTKLGANTLTLTGSNTYSGGTTVNEGTLLIDGSVASAVSVGANAAIGGTGTINSTLTLAADADLVFNLSDSLIVTGAVSLDNTFSISSLVNADGSAIDWSLVGAGTYTLIDTTGDFSNIQNFGVANAANLGGGKSAYFQNGSLELVVVVPEPSTWLLLTGGLTCALVMRRRRL